MRIAMVAPVDLRVPPIAYGGTELVVSLLTEELVRRGHDVTLFASGDSVTAARLIHPCSRYIRGSDRDLPTLTLLNVVNAYSLADSFDVIHNHTCAEGLAVAGFVRTPTVTTLHGHLTKDSAEVFRGYCQWYVTISQSAKTLIAPGGRFAGVVYNAIDCDSYPFEPGPRSDHLLFLSRMSMEKGPHLAIEAARKAGRRLVLAGNVHKPDEPYFKEMVAPLLDGDQFLYVGEVDAQRKRQLLCEAVCLLAPITWPEPFGIFLVEAMACGTPVIVLNRGAAPEVVVHGTTGFVVENVDEMAAAIEQVPSIDPFECRRHVEERFDAPRMVDDYLAVYHRVCERPSATEDQRTLPAWTATSRSTDLLPNMG